MFLLRMIYKRHIQSLITFMYVSRSGSYDYVFSKSGLKPNWPIENAYYVHEVLLRLSGVTTAYRNHNLYMQYKMHPTAIL